ncbi:MAG: nucleotidyltransferase family protein [Phycisphaeraceae bacterium]
MMTLLQKLTAHREQIRAIAARHGAVDLHVIGSVARGEQNEKSDIDLLVTFEQGRSLFDHGALIADLEALLQMKVDVISRGGLEPRFRQRVLNEAVSVDEFIRALQRRELLDAAGTVGFWPDFDHRDLRRGKKHAKE